MIYVVTKYQKQKVHIASLYDFYQTYSLSMKFIENDNLILLVILFLCMGLSTNKFLSENLDLNM